MGKKLCFLIALLCLLSGCYAANTGNQTSGKDLPQMPENFSSEQRHIFDYLQEIKLI